MDTPTKMKTRDFLGNELNVGDEVIYVEKGYRNFAKGRISRITPNQTVILDIIHPNIANYATTLKQTGSQLIKISQ